MSTTVFNDLTAIIFFLIFSHSYQADTQAGGSREREAILDGNVLLILLGFKSLSILQQLFIF